MSVTARSRRPGRCCVDSAAGRSAWRDSGPPRATRARGELRRAPGLSVHPQPLTAKRHPRGGRIAKLNGPHKHTAGQGQAGSPAAPTPTPRRPFARPALLRAPVCEPRPSRFPRLQFPLAANPPMRSDHGRARHKPTNEEPPPRACALLTAQVGRGPPLALPPSAGGAAVPSEALVAVAGGRPAS